MAVVIEAGAILGGVVFVLLRLRRRRVRRKDSTRALAEALSLREPYAGPGWKVPTRWL
ncbi:MAG TPA: hypothetical protein VGA20_09390 [Gemmatimonadales bacterium]